MPLPPLIALEEHFFSSTVLNSLDDKYVEQFKAIPGLREKLSSLSSVRLNDMNANQISLQIISHAPSGGVPSPSQCHSANNELAAAVQAHPTRFAGFAVLPMGSPSAAATELARCKHDLHFVGALIDNHAAGTHYDGPAYHAFWQAAQDLDMPIYLHPTWPTPEMASRNTGENITSGASKSLGSSGWGWHSDCGLHVLKLFAAGIFDRFPRLKIVIGHMGEMLPFQLERIFALSQRWGERQRVFRTVWRENLWVTTSGVWSLAPLACLLVNTDPKRILFSVDWPFEKNENGVKWMEELEGSGMVSREVMEGIAFRNSEELFGVRPPRR
ncbi:hypothetical protein MBLNU230_g8271t1 [Neophaeotheca triangularis]